MFTWVDHVFWALESIGFAFALALILRSRAHLRWFSVTLFCALQVLMNAALAIMYLRQAWAAYFYTQWPCQILLCGVKLLILWQVAVDGVHSVRLVPTGIRQGFVLVTLSAGLAGFLFGIHSFTWAQDLPTKALVLNRATNMTVVAVFSVFSLFSSVFALKWRPRGLRIDLGLNILAITDLLSFLAETEFRARLSFSYRLQCGCYLAAVSTWSLAFALRDHRPKRMSEEIQHAIKRVATRLADLPSQRGFTFK